MSPRDDTQRLRGIIFPMNKTDFRLFVLAVLDDGHGISKDAMDKLHTLNTDGIITDILGHVESTDDRFYLNEDHGLTA